MNLFVFIIGFILSTLFLFSLKAKLLHLSVSYYNKIISHTCDSICSVVFVLFFTFHSKLYFITLCSEFSSNKRNS